MKEKIPELYYFADNMMSLGNFDLIEPEAILKVVYMGWREIEPLTHAMNDDDQICPHELRSGLRDLINHVQDHRDDPRLASNVGQFFEVCVRSGYKTFQEIIDDTGCETLSANDLRSMFFKFIHPALGKAMPQEYKPEDLVVSLDDSGLPKANKAFTHKL